MTSAYNVEGPTPIFPSGSAETLTVKNIGTTTLYLDTAPTVGLNSFPLGPGSSQSWDANRPLWAAGMGTLLILENSGNLFDANAVATEILAGGLAAEIASQINIAGVPNYSRKVNLGTYTVYGDGTGASVDVTGYAAVQLSMYGNRVSDDPNHRVIFEIGSSVGTLMVNSVSDCASVYVRNLTTDTLELFGITGVGTVVTDECYITVVGITSPVATESGYFSQDQYKTGGAITYDLYESGSTGWIMNVTSATTTAKRLWMPHGNGVHMFGIKSAGASTEAIFNDPVSYTTVAYLKVASGNYANQMIVLPNRPLNLYLNFTSGLTRSEISLIPQP